MIFKDPVLDIAKGPDCRAKGIENIHTVAAVLDHLLNAAHLPLDPSEGYQLVLMVHSLFHTPRIAYPMGVCKRLERE